MVGTFFECHVQPYYHYIAASSSLRSSCFSIPQKTTKGMSTCCMSLPSKDMQYLDDTKDHNDEFVLKPDFSPAMKWNHPLLNSHRD